MCILIELSSFVCCNQLIVFTLLYGLFFLLNLLVNIVLKSRYTYIYVALFTLYSKIDIVDWQNHFSVDNLEQLHLVLEEVRIAWPPLNINYNHGRSCQMLKDLLLFLLKSANR